VPPVGFEPTRISAVDFESTVSTISPQGHLAKNESNVQTLYTGHHPDLLHLIKCSTTSSGIPELGFEPRQTPSKGADLPVSRFWITIPSNSMG
jgi:hypothetical protein